MSRLAGIVRAAVTPMIRRSIRRRLVTVDGVQHIPLDGPFILAPNHSSYFDHFLTGAVLLAVRGEPAWFLTKSEAFERPVSRFWHNVMLCLPVDRDRPTSANLARIAETLNRDAALVVYPEGTRGTADSLLPFKKGAFWFAVRHGVPVIPAGITGTRDVLPRGGRWPRRRPLHIAFGAALTDNLTLPRSQRITALLLQAQERIPELVAEAAAADPNSPDRLGPQIAERIDATLQPDGRCPQSALDRIDQTSRLIGARKAQDVDLRVQRLRIQGLRATSAGPVRRLVLGYPIRRKGLRLLQPAPQHPMANYLVGRWHLGMPRVLGGRSCQAVEHFGRAAGSAPAADTRYAMGLAEALIADGRPDEAVVPLTTVFTQTPATQRGQGRIQRAGAMLSAITPPGPAEDRQDVTTAPHSVQTRTAGSTAGGSA
jgi:1-acyl-sn-glycerol-3-phosphate acyltransferase